MKVKWISLMMVLLSLIITSPASALRCSGKVIDRGMPQAEILESCGDPTWVDEREEERFSRRCRDPFFWTDPDYNGRFEEHYYSYGGRRFKGCKTLVIIQEWFYNFGPSRLTQTLIFENSRLVAIRQGGYGY